MSITDLLSKGSFPRLGRRGDAPAADAAAADAPAETGGDGQTPAATLDAFFAGVPLPDAAHTVTPAVPAPPTRRTARPAMRPLPSRAVLAIGGLSLACVTLLAALVLAAAAPSPDAPLQAEAPVEAPGAGAAPTTAVPTTSSASDAPAEPVAEAPADGTAPRDVPADMLAQLEAAADAPLPTELTLLLAAMQYSFGADGRDFAPALRPFAYRMASRFEWNPDAFEIAVAAPDAALAQARAARLGQLFSAAIASGRLTITPRAGVHALSLVTE